MKKHKKANNGLMIMASLLIISLFFISVGFSALSTTLNLNGISYFEPVGMIRVMSINLNKLNQADEIDSSYSNDTISVTLDINDVSGTATYDVRITNLGETDKVLKRINNEIFTNPEIEYEIEGLKVDDIIRKKQSVDFKITFKYKNDVVIPLDNRLNSKIRFIFDDYEDNSMAYFKQYDGTSSFMGFSKDSITSFSRKKDITKEEVLAKSGVTLISNTANDNFKSDYEIYGYIENGNFYWWSEAPIVYFHPNTIRAFYKLSNVITIDLTDISTSYVENFSHWFDTDRNLKNIIGKIDTSGLKLEYNDNFNYRDDTNNDSSSNKGLTYMFNDCNNLESIDLSLFYTTNASDMKRMFGGCKKIKSLDLSGFDTSNVKSMYWMFRNMNSLQDIDLSGFDTSNVENMFGMFVQNSVIKTIRLGEKFDTSKVKNMGNMFYNDGSLTTIYAQSDFVRNSGVLSSGMFNNTTKLVGAAGTEYAFSYNSKYKNHTYAQIATPEQQGYFTLYEGSITYTITYDLDGGVATNPGTYSSSTETFALTAPRKTGYKFIGWTGSNGVEPELNVEIKKGSTGNRKYVANYEANQYTVIFDNNTGTGSMENQVYSYGEFKSLNKNTFTKDDYEFECWNTNRDGTGIDIQDEKEVGNLTLGSSITLYAKWKKNTSEIKRTFNLPGPCNFNGENSNIGGVNCSLYSNTNYIDTGIYLFDSNNINEDFDLSFNIDEYNPSQATAQATILNSIPEISSTNNPGFVIRRESNNINIKIQDGKTSNSVSTVYSKVSKIRIVRKNKKICYSVNDEDLKFGFDFTNFNEPFDVPVTLGASLKSDGTPWRFTKVTLSNIRIRVGTLNDVTCE